VLMGHRDMRLRWRGRRGMLLLDRRGMARMRELVEVAQAAVLWFLSCSKTVCAVQRHAVLVMSFVMRCVSPGSVVGRKRSELVSAIVPQSH
jgi:hypothetical protein